MASSAPPPRRRPPLPRPAIPSSCGCSLTRACPRFPQPRRAGPHSAQGYEIQVEHADPRRYRVHSWQECGVAHLKEWAAACQAVEQCLSRFPKDYIRLV
ncbi:ribulose bisphosphate carboxylase small subunit, partial [Synechococcus sp. H70.1]